MQCNSTRFTTWITLNCLGFINNYPACRPAACKKFLQSQLGKHAWKQSDRGAEEVEKFSVLFEIVEAAL